MESVTEQPGSAGRPGVVEWKPPRSREDADEAIITLSNDIGLILAQLAEDQASWCQRTARSPAEYGTWRRRALFAKVHKEGQLRESKRVRGQLSGIALENGSAPPSGLVAELVPLCRHLVEVWIADGDRSAATALSAAIGAVAELLHRVTEQPETGPTDGSSLVQGERARPMVLESSLSSKRP